MNHYGRHLSPAKLLCDTGAHRVRGRFDYSAIGTVVNLASRLCGEAKDGQILVDGKMMAAIETVAATESIGAQYPVTRHHLADLITRRG
jgi:class 3 adenylate cyclase